MSFMPRPIFTSLSPNTEKEDALLALRLLFSPGRWVKGKAEEELKELFNTFLGKRRVFLLNSGRSALMVLLKALNFEEKSEVIVQGFTCNALINPIKWSNLSPVYVDIRRGSLCMDPLKLKKKISSRTKAVIVQHTFGYPAEIEKIRKICNENNLVLIEDCAHALGGSRGEKKLGTFGDASFFSLGRNKIISSVFGGVLVVNSNDLAKKVEKKFGKISYPSIRWTIGKILHPIFFTFLVKPLFSVFSVGKGIMLVLQRLNFFGRSVSKKEKEGERPNFFPKKMPNSLAKLGVLQFQKLDKFIARQRETARFYRENLLSGKVSLTSSSPGRVYMRFPVLVKNRDTDKILKEAKKKEIYLDDGWRGLPVVPPGTNQEKMDYYWGECPVAERVAREIINLPTNIHIDKKKAERVVQFLNSELEDEG